MSARIFILIAMLIKQIYSIFLAHAADVQRKKPLPEEVSDIYDAERYQTFLDFSADKKKLRNKFKIIDLILECLILFSPIYGYIEEFSGQNPYGVFFITYAVMWIVGTITEVWASYEVTFILLEKYGLNKKDKKEFIKDEVLEQAFSLIIMAVIMLVIVYIGEHLAIWTNNFSVGLIKSILICVAIFAVVFIVIVIAQLLSYVLIKKQYIFTPMEEGELKDKINALQAESKKKVKYLYIYNESKKTTTKNAFLLKLFWHREFGIADNFINENAEDELLAVLSHEVGHLKHKKNMKNFISYAFIVVIGIAIVYIVSNPDVCLWINKWIRESFGITTNNYYLMFIVYSYIITPIFFLSGIYRAYVSKCEEYEADREAVRNGYGEALIKTFKTLSNDELVDVNPHPFVEFTEYDHPGMYRRIKAIREAIDKQ